MKKPILSLTGLMNVGKKKEERFQVGFQGSLKLYPQRIWTQYDACSSANMTGSPEILWGIYLPSKSPLRTKKTSKTLLPYGTRKWKRSSATYNRMAPILLTSSRRGRKVGQMASRPAAKTIVLTVLGMFIFAEVWAKYLHGQLSKAALLEELKPAKLPVELDDV